MPREGCGGTGQDVLQRVAEEADPRAGPAAPQNPPLGSPPPPPTAAKGGWSTEQGQPLVPPPRQRQGNHVQSFRANPRRVPTSARCPILRFRARGGGGPNENTHQSLCKRGRRRASTPMRELVGGAKGVGSLRDLNLNGRPLTTALSVSEGDWSSCVIGNLWSSVGGEETTQPAAAVVAAGDVPGAGSGGHFLGQGTAEARAPSPDRRAWICIPFPGRALAFKVNPGVGCLGQMPPKLLQVTMCTLCAPLLPGG